MAEWTTFVGLTGVVLVLLLVLARASQSLIVDSSSLESSGRTFAPGSEPEPAGELVSDETTGTDDGRGHERPRSLSTAALLVNVAISQGLFGVLLLAGAWYAEIPTEALGLSSPPFAGVSSSLAVGVGLGVGLYVADEIAAAFAERVGVKHADDLRELLAPTSAVGWVVLLFVILPVIAGFEELLFRGAVIGVVSVGFGVSPWLLAVVSTLAFALAHGAQGPGGMVVTGVLGFVLAAAFVLTGSLVVVIAAHYVVNALEFVVHEGLGVEWA